MSVDCRKRHCFISGLLAGPVKIKLRRLKPQPNISTAIDEDIISRNLQPLQENKQKKIKAQEAYYSKNDGGVSPLIRDSFRRPVKARLGVMPFGINTRPTGNNTIRMRKLRVNIAQERLNRIRSRNNSLVSSTPKKIRLRRLMSTPSLLPRPQNLKVYMVHYISTVARIVYKLD
nr:unnamed protein product [Callosobruchus analis]